MQDKPTTEALNRSEFLRSLGLSSAALMAFYCMGTLTSCSSSKSDPAPATIPTTNPGTGTGTTTTTGFTGNADPTKGTINFTLDLSTTTYSGLKTEGGFVSVGGIVVADVKGGKLVAIGRICTHQQGELSYRLATNDFQCNLHGGLYNTDGSVKESPPVQGVKSYKATLSGTILTVIE